MKIHLHNELETIQLGATLACVLTSGLKIYLHGDLGTGKTTFARALIQGAGYQGHVKSPTYTLTEQYPIVIGDSSVNVIHFDLYRMNTPEEFLDAGFREDFNSHNICIVEWPEKAEPLLPSADLNIFFKIADNGGRDIELQGLSEKGSLCLDRLHPALKT